MKKGWALAAALTIVLLTAGLRLHRLGEQSLWNDEGSAYVQATRSFADIAANAARDIHPPGYYWLLAVWRDLTGDTEFALRSLSALASTLTGALVIGLGWRLFGAASALAAGAFFSLNTFSIHYGQEARMYALLALWAALALWLLAGLLTADERRWHQALALGIINATGLYTQYAYPFVMLAQGAIVALWAMRRTTSPHHPNPADPKRRGVASGRLQGIGAFAASGIVSVMLYLPWLPTAWKQVTQWPSTGEPIRLNEALTTIAGWFTFGMTSAAVQDAEAYLPLGLALLATGLLIRMLWRRGAESWQPLLPLAWALVPAGLFLALGLYRPANLKLLLPAQAGWVLAMGAGLGGWWTLGQRGMGWAGRLTRLFATLQAIWLGVFFAGGLNLIYDDPRFRRADYRAMAAQIEANARPGDAIILDAPNQEEVFRYYYRGDAPVYPLPIGLGGDDAATLAAVQQIIEGHERITVLFWGEGERDPNRVVETTLDSESFEAGQDVWYGDVRLARYVTPVEMPAVRRISARFGPDILLDGYALSGRVQQPGGVLQVRLDWQTQAPLMKRYKVFVQLLNAGGVLVAQRDSEPAGGSQPTTSWQPGEIVIDRHGLAIPAEIPPGPYLLIIGLYDRDDPAERLTGPDGRTYVELGLITVRRD